MIEVVAEWGQSCRGNLDIAKRQADAAKAAGCTWSKWQAFDPARLASRYARRYWDPNLGGQDDQLATFTDNGMLAPADWAKLGAHCRAIGIGFMCTPFDMESVKLLVGAGIEAFKIASADTTFQDLVDAVGVTGTPVFMSAGASAEAEIIRALGWLEAAGSGPVTLMACSLSYPTVDSDVNLGRIVSLAEMGYPVGYSDHSLGVETALAATAIGAVVLEKHVTIQERGGARLGSARPGEAVQGMAWAVPDDNMALDPDQLAEYVRLAQLGARLRGDATLAPSPAEMAAREGARRSAYATQDLPAGHTLHPSDVAWLRPCPPGTNTIEPFDRDWLFGRRHDLVKPIPAGAPIGFDDLL